jgi:hypothetical protein
MFLRRQLTRPHPICKRSHCLAMARLVVQHEGSSDWAQQPVAALCGHVGIRETTMRMLMRAKIPVEAGNVGLTEDTLLATPVATAVCGVFMSSLT